MTPDELIARACPKIGELGWQFYFDEGTVARGAELGLDVLSFYFLGRGGVLGDVEPAVVMSAFGYFNPEVVAAMWTSASCQVAPRDGARAYLACCAEFGRRRFADLDDLDVFCVAAQTVRDAADPVALTLFAAVAAEPLVDDLPGRAMQLVTTFRELRGSAHLLAVRAVGVAARTAHYIRRPEMYGLFGWDESDHPVVADADRAALDRADELTDALVRPAFSALDEQGADALFDGLVAMEAALAAG